MSDVHESRLITLRWLKLSVQFKLWCLSSLCVLLSGRIGRSYSDKCLEILTGLLGLKQDQITSGINHLPLGERVDHSFIVTLCFSLSALPCSPQRWCRRYGTWSGCVLSVVILCLWSWRAVKKCCRTARLDLRLYRCLMLNASQLQWFHLIKKYMLVRRKFFNKTLCF